MKEKIHPNKCPFCDGENIEFAHDQPDVWVECHECGAQGPEEETLNMAAKAWNEARQGEIDRLAARNAELVEAVKALLEREWIVSQEYGDFCPFCEGQKPIVITSKMDQKDIDVINRINQTAGHAPDCSRKRAAALVGKARNDGL